MVHSKQETLLLLLLLLLLTLTLIITISKLCERITVSSHTIHCKL